MAAFGWIVLALVFLDELLAMAGLGVYGWSTSLPWLMVWLLPLLGMLAWFLFASPKARYGSAVVRPVVKVLVFSVVVNALAILPGIRELAAEGPAAAGSQPR